MTFGKSFDFHLRLSWFPSAGGMRKFGPDDFNLRKEKEKDSAVVFWDADCASRAVPCPKDRGRRGRTEPEKGHQDSLHIPPVSGPTADAPTQNLLEPEAQQLPSIDGAFPQPFPCQREASNMSAVELEKATKVTPVPPTLTLNVLIHCVKPKPVTRRTHEI